MTEKNNKDAGQSAIVRSRLRWGSKIEKARDPISGKWGYSVVDMVSLDEQADSECSPDEQERSPHEQNTAECSPREQIDDGCSPHEQKRSPHEQKCSPGERDLKKTPLRKTLKKNQKQKSPQDNELKPAALVFSSPPYCFFCEFSIN